VIIVSLVTTTGLGIPLRPRETF